MSALQASFIPFGHDCVRVEQPPDEAMAAPHSPEETHWRSRDDEALDAVLNRGGAPPPPSFAARGVAVPFTTPTLAEARARRSPSGAAPELVVPSAVGHRGWYVVPWDGVPALAPLTLHDRVLHATLASLSQPTPEGVRAAARGAALTGLAGRAAMAAAAEAEERARRGLERTRTEQLTRLLTATGLREGNGADALEMRGQIALDAIASRARIPASRMTEAFGQLVAAVAPLGGAAQHAEAAVPRELAALVQLRAALEDRAERADADAARVAAHLVRVILVFERCTRRTLTTALAAVGDLPMVLLRWHRPDSQVATLLARPAWVIDGWADLGGLWQAAQAAGEPERPTLARLLQLAPALPAEAEAWTGERIALPAGQPRGLGEGQDWRDQALLMERTARHEAMRAMVP